MDDRIRQHIIEQTHERGATPVAARQSGSRQMGVPHERSDHDVRVLFATPGWTYARGAQQTFDFKDEENDIDIHAWNVDKFAGMVRETNPSAVEFLLSTKDYIPDRSRMLETLERTLKGSANRMALYYHYRSLAENNYKKYLRTGNDYTLGRSFYVVRAISYAKYIRETNNIPPLNVFDFTAKADGYADGLLNSLAIAKKEGDGPLPVEDSTIGTAIEKGTFPDIEKFVEDELDEEPEPTERRTKSMDNYLVDIFLQTAITGDAGVYDY